MKFKNIKKLILFGGSRILFDFVSYARKNPSFEITVFSSGRHLDEIVPGNNFTLRAFFKKQKVLHYDSEDINKDKNLKKEATPDSLGIAFGASWMFEKKTAELFSKNHFLDFMGIDLPRYRGGAHYTWQILHQNKIGCANLQIIYGGADTFHKGEIVFRENFTLPQNIQKPIDYFDYISKKEMEFLKKFLVGVFGGKDFKFENLDESKSSCFPFLNTKINGFINWNWHAKDLFLFISAFDDPYAGASTFWKDKIVFLKGCKILPAEENYHPFTSGIVVRKNKDGIFVAAVGGLLCVSAVLNESGKNITKDIGLGDRLFTPSAKLDEAMQFETIYSASGLKNNRK